jgi:hypothetical protein
MLWIDIEIDDDAILNLADCVDGGIVSLSRLWNREGDIRRLPWIRKRNLVLLEIRGGPKIPVPEPVSAGVERGELPLKRADSF